MTSYTKYVLYAKVKLHRCFRVLNTLGNKQNDRDDRHSMDLSWRLESSSKPSFFLFFLLLSVHTLDVLSVFYRYYCMKFIIRNASYKFYCPPIFLEMRVIHWSSTDNIIFLLDIAMFEKNDNFSCSTKIDFYVINFFFLFYFYYCTKIHGKHAWIF